MYSTFNEGKSVIAERFIRTLKNKIYKHMAAISENVYYDALDDIVNKYNNTVHRTIKIKPIDVTKDPKFKVGDHVRISKYKNIFAKGYTPNWSEEIFIISKINNTVPWTYVISDMNGEDVTGNFYEKELQSINQQIFRIEKIIKRKSNELYAKWKGYDDSLNSWVNKKDIL